jgi:hypothetical protein
MSLLGNKFGAKYDVTIFDRRSVNPDRIRLYYICFYLQSHRFHTKHVLIYLCIGEKKGKDNKIGTRCNMMYKVRTKKIRTKYERIKLHVYSMRSTGIVTYDSIETKRRKDFCPRVQLYKT